MTAPVAALPLENLPRAARLALVAALLGVFLGGAAVWLGFAESSIALAGFGGACLLQVPTALGVRSRILEGLGNRGLDRELRTLRVISHLVRLLALIVLSVSAYALYDHQVPEGTLSSLGLGVLAMGLLAPLWYAKQSLSELHPTLALDATRARAAWELAGLLLIGGLLGRWFPWADAITGIALALRLFFEGQSLAKVTTLTAACGGCGSGCGCG